MTKKEQLYYLINSYHDGEYDTVTFCNEFVRIFYPDTPVDELTETELAEFNKLASIVVRFSQFEEDHINCPNAFFTEHDVKNIAEQVYDSLVK